MAAILETLLKSSVNKLQDVIMDEAILILGVEEELTKLLRRVELIQCCIYDAEKRRTKEQAVNNWLGQLRDVIYDVDEILDVARCKGSKLLADHPSPSSDKSVAYISTFNNSTQPIGNGQTSKLIRSSNLVEPNLVGKEIGVGKTTLAQKIYNDQKIKGSFKMHAWICVSQDYNQITLLKEVLRNIGVHHEQGETITELQRKLAETIEGKSFFLVLDDVWHSNVWTDLLRPALHETTARVILVTTRDDQITRRIGLLWKSMNINEEKEVQNLRNTGIEIVHKCGRLPLAIKVTASALASRDLTEHEWRKYLARYVGSQSMLLDEIEEALYLSYDELTHRLKQCFLYCALYAEDSIIERDEVTLLWIAEGFIEEQQGQLLEDIAEEYYYELIHRNLLQPDIIRFDQSMCKMHDLLRQLACNISREECFIGDVESLRGENMSKLRRVTAVTKKDMLVLSRVDKVDVKVRTFLTVKGPRRIEDTVFKRFLLLRVLVLNYTLVQSIPDYIGKLIHLRLLNLDYTGISCLPESIGSLKNLQVLSLRWCDDLHNLPSTVTMLSSLRCLDLFGTKIIQVPKGIGKLKLLTYLGKYPVGDGSDNAVVQNGWKLEELSSLSQIRYLTLVKLERAAHCNTNTVLAIKRHLQKLTLEWTGHGEGSHSEEDASNAEKVFKQLIPPPNLEDLCIIRFFGQRYPTWFGTTLLSSLIYLKLVDVRSCVELPSIGQLPNLKYLKIDGAHAVTKVGPEFVGCKKGDLVCNKLVAFPKLEWLIFKDMPNWELWSFFEEGVVADGRGEDGAAEIRKEDVQYARLKLLPRLLELKIHGCPKLRDLPQQLGKDTAYLKELSLRELNKLKAVEDRPMLSEVLVIGYCEGLERICDLPQVSGLRVFGCPNLSHVEGLGSLQQLWLGEYMQEVSSRWVPGLQEQHRRLHGEDLEVYTI
uniref:NBS-LRR disease resistance protein n=1 Tax=Dasypyrum villosum TaxID=40247 RepID=A0A8K1IB39_9POAL|nr:NBS-LRR disease resistance protein [Dasypyrum villosum]